MTHIRAFYRTSFILTIILTAFSSLGWSACSGSNSNQTCTSTVSVSVLQNSHASVYPVSQSVGTPTSMVGPVTHVDVTVNGLTAADNFNSGELMLVAPDGTQLVILVWPGDGATSFGPANLQVIDTGTDQCLGLGLSSPAKAQNCNDPSTGSTSTGTGQPNGFSTVVAPGSSCTSTTCLSVTTTRTIDNTFNAVSNANGTWSLYVINNTPFSSPTYTFTGWSVHVTTSGVAAAGTTTSVSPANQSVLRTTPGASDPATVTAMVTSGSTVSGGTVSFFDNGNPVTCSNVGGQTVASGVATCTMTFTQEGVHPITASYNGTSGFAPSNSPANSPANVTVSDRTHTTGVGATGGTFCNQGSIVLAGNRSPGIPYASNIFVGTNGAPNLVGVITNLTVDTLGDTATNAGNVSMLLVSPAGTPYVIWSDAFQNLNSTSGPVDIHFSDGGSTLLPNGGGLTGGIFKPTDYNASPNDDQGGVLGFPAPAPQSGFLFPDTLGGFVPGGPQTFQTAFNGAGATGTWSLYVMNKGTNTGGVSNGWCLNFTVNPNLHSTNTALNASPAASYTSAPFSTKFPPVPANDYVTLTATVTSDQAVNQGTVTFTENGNNLVCGFGGSANGSIVVGGTAICRTTFTTEGNHTIRAQYHDGSLTGFGDSNGTTLERTDSHSTRSPLATTVSATTTYSYCNPAQIHIPGFTAAAAPGNPYPSNVFINDIPGTIKNVAVSIPDLNPQQGSLQDLTSMLVGPNQNITDSLDVMSHVGRNASGFAINITLDDAGNKGHFTQDVSDPTSGAWQPTSFGSPVYPALIPPGPYPPPVGTPQYAFPSGAFTFASVYGSGPANTRTGLGTWSLFQQTTANGDVIVEGNGTTVPGWCMTITINPPVLTITKSDQGMHFRQGQQAAMVYTLLVHNSGPGPTGGKLSVSDALPTGLTGSPTPGSGTGWTCAGTTTITCTSQDLIPVGGDYPLLTLSVNVANNAASSPGNSTHMLSNQGAVTGGGAVVTAMSNITSTFVEQVADMTITKVHNGTFTEGDTGDTYTITASNAALHGPTVGQVMVTDTIPTGLTLTNAAGTNWACTVTPPSFSCTRSDVLQSGSSYEDITVTVNVATNAPTPIMNTATVSGGGELDTSNDTSTDTVAVVQLPDLTIAKSHVGTNFSQGQQGAQYTLTLSNGGGLATSGTVTVTDTLPTGLTFVSGSGTGWTCSASGQVVTCTDSATPIAAGGTSVITLNVNVATNTATPRSNTATVACTCTESNTNNNSSNTDMVTVTQLPDLTVAKIHAPANFTVNDVNDTFTITVTNGGFAATSGTVTVTDTLPAGLTFNGSTTAGWSCTAVAQVVTCTSTGVIASGGGTSAVVLNVNVASSTGSPLTNNVSVGCTCTESTTGNNTGSDMVTVLQVVNITLDATPSGQGLTISLDGGTVFTAPHTYALIPGSTHTIATTSPQPVSPVGTEYVFNHWSDNGALSHQITVPAAAATYTATFDTFYQLTLAVSPNGGGTVSPASGSFFPANFTVNISATANAGYSFTSWAGPVTNPNSAATTVVMSQPQSVTANFTALATNLGAGSTGKSGPINARQWNFTITNTGPGAANAALLTSFTLAQSGGPACTSPPVVGTVSVNGGAPQSLPNVALGNMGPNTSIPVVVTIDFSTCTTAARFTQTIGLSANGGATTASVPRYNQFP